MASTRDFSASLPKLPGLSFSDKIPRNNTRPKAQGLKFCNGMPVVVSFGNEEDDESPNHNATSNSRSGELGESALLKSPSHAAGASGFAKTSKPLPPAPFVDVSHDKQALRFYCYLEENVIESNMENRRMRKLVLIFSLFDQTVLLCETKTDNSGLPQGTFLKRTKVPGLSIDQFVIGQTVHVFGHKLHIYDCDAFTRRYLVDVLGFEDAEAQSPPQGEYETKRSRAIPGGVPRSAELVEEDREMKRYLEFSSTGRASVPSTKEKNEMQEFLSRDRDVLRFYAVWDDRNSLFGDYHYYTIYYFRSNKTVAMTEKLPPNSGCDEIPKTHMPMKVPRNFNGLGSLSDANGDFISEADLCPIGKRVTIFGKDLLIYDTDQRTRKFMTEELGLSGKDVDPIKVGIEKKPTPKAEPPPYNGFGLEEDSLNNWKYLILRPPKRDFDKMMKKDKLRFEAKLVNGSPAEADRRFIVTYHVCDDTISISAKDSRNSGDVGGRILKNHHEAGVDASKLFVGAEVTINCRQYKLLTTEEATLKYMEARPKEFSISDANRILKRLRELILAKHVKIRDAFRSIDTDHSGSITFEEFKTLCDQLNMDLVDQEIITLMRFFDKDNDGLIGYADFCDVVLPPNYEDPTKSQFDGSNNRRVEILDAAGMEAMNAAQIKEHEHKTQAAQRAAFKKFRDRFDQQRLVHTAALRVATDGSSDSRIGREELLKVIRNGMKLDSVMFSDTEYQAVAGAFFAPGRQRIDLSDFLKIVDGTDTWHLEKKKQ
eukprot:ANDGO_05634.mRNA.1 hypothetical protein NAEGRDRAFT_81047